MTRIKTLFCLILPALGLMPVAVGAQDFAAVGTRAAGMGGAFVGVADDASAIYWNPAGLAAGSYFSLVLDRTDAETAPEGFFGNRKSSYFLGLAMPALGVGYYRLHAATVSPAALLTANAETQPSRNLSVVDQLRVDSLITHHAGLTLVQSIYPGIAVGSTVKLVRGIAGSVMLPPMDAEEALGHPDADLVLGRASNKFDMDLGVMATGGGLKLGLTVRNLFEPAFVASDPSRELSLERQARAGLSYAVTNNWVAAADVDLLPGRDAFGERRDFAIGVEGRLAQRILVRSGVALNMMNSSETPSGRAAYSVGGSYAAKASVYVDGFFTAGGDRVGTKWGISARFVY